MSLEPMARPKSPALMETALALAVGAAVYVLWPLTGLMRLGREEVWFGLGWALLLALPVLGQPRANADAAQAGPEGQPSLSPQACQRAALLAGGLFVGLLLAGRELGNYKLWLGVVYLGAITLRLAGLGLTLRQLLPPQPRRDPRLALGIALLTGLAGVLMIPWLRPDLAAAWPPPLPQALRPLAAAILWGAIVGSLFFVLRLWGVGTRAAWFTFLALGLGPGPALAVGWFRLLFLALALVLLWGLALPRLLRPAAGADTLLEPEPLPLYWLLRALLLLWWGVGAAFALALAWWQPQAAGLFSQSIWLRGVGLGAFLVACAGLLVEYSLPLLGRPELTGQQGQGKTQGVILSALVLLAALSPLLLVRPPAAESSASRLPAASRADILASPRTLDPEHPEVEIRVPPWLSGVTRVFVVSLLAHGLDMAQGEAVAQLVATDDQDIPHIFSLRAGVDTAEWALNKREVATHVRHAPARVAQAWQVFEPTGEAFQAQTYYTGLYLGSEVHRLKSVTLRYLYQNPPGRHPVTLEVRRVFVN
ncbi:MAG: hypothetical protein HY794_17130 [Desulfarculus sp.]|nr:hypothetical protein [Desulfarculus sp.]